MNPTCETTVFGRKVTIAVPTTVEAYNTLAKRAEGALEDAIDHEIAHGTLGAIRKAIVAAVEKATGIPRKALSSNPPVYVEKDGKRSEVTKPEPEQKYFDRVVAEKGLDAATAFEDLFVSVSSGGSAEVKFSPAATPRQPAKPPVLHSDYITSAKANMSKIDDAKINKALAKFIPADKAVFKRTADLEASAVALGWLLREMELARRKQPVLLA